MGDNNTVSLTDGNFSQVRLKVMYQNNRTPASYRDDHPVYDTSFSMKDIAIMLDKYELGTFQRDCRTIWQFVRGAICQIALQLI